MQLYLKLTLFIIMRRKDNSTFTNIQKVITKYYIY